MLQLIHSPKPAPALWPELGPIEDWYLLKDGNTTVAAGSKRHCLWWQNWLETNVADAAQSGSACLRELAR